MSDPEPTVFIVDDDEAVRDALEVLLLSVGLPSEGYGSANAFLESYDPDRPGCLVLDIRMPGMSGLQLQRQLRQLGDPPPIIFITGHGDVAMAVQAVRAGALDFIEKPFRDQELLDKIQRGMEIDADRRRSLLERRTVEARLAELTARERQVLDLVVEGHANKEIAALLEVSARTVEIHRAKVMQKMEAESLATLVRTISELVRDT